MFFSMLLFNELGRVAFMVTMDSGVCGVYLGSGGLITIIVDNIGLLDGFFGVVMNDSGEVGFVVVGFGVYIGSGGLVIFVVDDGGVYFQFDVFVLNVVGDVAFFVSFDVGGEGIFFGDDVVVDKLI